MARRILFVETTSLFRDPEKELFIDAWVDVDWKLRMAIDDWTGDIQTAPPTYKVRPHHEPGEHNHYGVLSDPEQITWLDKAMTKPSHDHSYGAISLIARVNELGVRNLEGRKGFAVEVMTGIDADNFIASEKSASVIAFLKKHWWQIGLVLLAVWWWFIARPG